MAEMESIIKLYKHVMAGHRMGRLWKFKIDDGNEWVRVGGVADCNKKDLEE